MIFDNKLVIILKLAEISVPASAGWISRVIQYVLKYNMCLDKVSDWNVDKCVKAILIITTLV